MLTLILIHDHDVAVSSMAAREVIAEFTVDPAPRANAPATKKS
ncbi:hypothetical protein [Microbacterium esteraromaticum]|nr:hypothetical protein [Microbacterium esteraromaticum]